MQIRCTFCKTAIEVDTAVTAPERCPACSTLFAADSPLLDGLKPGDRIEHFELLDLIGTGSYGAVWKSRDTELDRIVTLKLPRREMLDIDRFIREAQAAAQVQHPGIVRVYEVSGQGDRPYIAAEFIDGKTLSAWLEKEQPSFQQTAEICQQLALAIHAAHEMGVVHRDLKPDNVLVDQQNKVHITDFGIAKRLDGQATLTLDGQIIGTPAYMSPEQARGDGHKATPQSDVYSLGAVLYHLLSGTQPFKGAMHSIISLVLSEEPKALDSTVPEGLRKICSKAMSKSLDSRYATAADLGSDLNRFLAGDKISIPDEVSAPSAKRPAGLFGRINQRVQENPLVALAVGVILIIPFAYMLGRPGSTEDAEDAVLAPREMQVIIKTDPPARKILFVPVCQMTCYRDESRPCVERDQLTEPEIEVTLESGTYLIVAQAINGDFHEVLRTVPGTAAKQGDFKHNQWTVELSQDRLRLPSIKLHATNDVVGREDLILVPGGNGTFGYGDGAAQKHEAFVNPYYLQKAEVSGDDVQDFLAATQVKRTGILGRISPARNVDINVMLGYLEFHGLRLPVDVEYEFATTNGGKDVPTGELSQVYYVSDIWIPPADRKAGHFGHFGLRSAPAEVTWSHGASQTALLKDDYPELRGGPANWSVRGVHTDHMKFAGWEQATTVLDRLSVLTVDIAHPDIGFRGARSEQPRWHWDDIGVPERYRWSSSGVKP